MALKINKESYELYKNVFEVLWQFKMALMKVEADNIGLDIGQIPSPIDSLNEWEKRSKSTALKGLKTSLNDLLTEMYLYLNKEILQMVDTALKTKNLPGFFDLSAELKDTVKQILKRGSIKSESEYYITIELLSDTTTSLTNDDRMILNKAVSAFEIYKTK